MDVSAFIFAVLALISSVPFIYLHEEYKFLHKNTTNFQEFPFELRRLQSRSTPSSMRESCLKYNVAPGNRVNTSDGLRRLRLRMKASNYDAYIVPSSDEHQSEYIADHDKRRQFISGFSGSAGSAIILQDVAALWTDGRYFLQAESELDCNWLLMKRGEKDVPSLDDWIIKTLAPGSNIGADSKLIAYDKWILLKGKFENANLTLHADGINLIDDIWSIPQGRVHESVAHVFIHDVKYAGETWQDKVRRVLNETGGSALIVTALDEISWLFNLRGNDVTYTPVFKAYALISELFIRLYIKNLKVTPEVKQYLCPKSDNTSECVEVVEYNKAFSDVEHMIDKFDKIVVSSSSSYAIVNLIPKAKRVLQSGPSLISKLKVIKNSIEVAGMKNAALKDSAAIVDFIAMLDEEVKNGKHWDEIKASRELTKYRREQELNQGPSFETISAFGANAAVIHYTPQISTNRNINDKHLYLLDSGGQYLDGTTDITRTFHFGEPNEFEVEAYTRVLMGVIDLFSAIFPDGVKGTTLDILARRPLYSIGLNYLHGTGHGIGSFLSIHEGPIKIANPAIAEGYPLKPGMFLSNEPGFYAADKFGIRLETMMMVVKAFTPHKFNNIEYYTFEPVSFTPFEPRLIDLHLLSRKQKEWLNWYNMKTRNTVGLLLKKQNRKRGFRWLLSKTEFIPVEENILSSSSSSSSFYFQFHILLIIFIKYLIF